MIFSYRCQPLLLVCYLPSESVRLLRHVEEVLARMFMT